MRYAQMVCASSANIGDDIQSIAAASRLPKVDLYLDREELDAVEGSAPTCVVMNAWFMRSHRWPPSEFLRPIFVGFHITPERRDLISRHAEYLKRHEPIGTRDKGTAEFLNSLGVQAEVTYCMSLTFPPRVKAPANGKVIIVDANGIPIPRVVRRKAVRLTHEIVGMRDATKIQYARELIAFYRDNARLVVTTRLHCALPCIAMGIPVVFFGNPRDYRTAIVSDLGGTVYNRYLFRKPVLGVLAAAFGMVDWSPKPIDVSAIRQRLLDEIENRIQHIQK